MEQGINLHTSLLDRPSDPGHAHEFLGRRVGRLDPRLPICPYTVLSSRMIRRAVSASRWPPGFVCNEHVGPAARAR